MPARTISAIALLALLGAIGVGIYGTATLHTQNAAFLQWTQWNEADVQVSVRTDETRLTTEFAAYVIRAPSQRGVGTGGVLLPQYFETSKADFDRAERKTREGTETRWREVASGWPMRCVRCRVNSPLEVRGGWFRRQPKDVFDAQYAPVVAWWPIPLGLFVDWACWAGTLGTVWAGALGARHGVRVLRKRAADRRESCLGCGYPLKGLTMNICPECGKRFTDNSGAPLLPPRES